MSLTVGIDPGLSGAVAVLDSYGVLLEVHDMPVVDRNVSAVLLSDLLNDSAFGDGGEPTAVIEQVSSSPQQGVSSAFKFGRGYGVIEGVVAGLRIHTVKVVSSKWKPVMGLNRDKEVSRRRALDRWPKMSASFARKKDDGRAEAALVALYHMIATGQVTS